VCLTGIFDLIIVILRWVRRFDYTKKEILAIFFPRMIMVFAKTMSNTARPWRNKFLKCKPLVTGVCWEFVVIIDDDDGKASSSKNRAFMITCCR